MLFKQEIELILLRNVQYNGKTILGMIDHICVKIRQNYARKYVLTHWL